MKTIVLDTNFLTIPYQFKVDIFEEFNRLVDEKYELVTIDSVIKELKELSKGRGKDSIAARIGLEFIESKDIKIIETKGENTDTALLNLADKDIIIATNDKILIQKLKNNKRNIIRLKQKKYLVIE